MDYKLLSNYSSVVKASLTHDWKLTQSLWTEEEEPLALLVTNYYDTQQLTEITELDQSSIVALIDFCDKWLFDELKIKLINFQAFYYKAICTEKIKHIQITLSEGQYSDYTSKVWNFYLKNYTPELEQLLLDCVFQIEIVPKSNLCKTHYFQTDWYQTINEKELLEWFHQNWAKDTYKYYCCILCNGNLYHESNFGGNHIIRVDDETLQCSNCKKTKCIIGYMLIDPNTNILAKISQLQSLFYNDLTDSIKENIDFRKRKEPFLTEALVGQFKWEIFIDNRDFISYRPTPESRLLFDLPDNFIIDAFSSYSYYEGKLEID
jgi:hypothetical protein